MLKQIDVRGARFSALLTTFVLALTLATESWILALWQTAVFAIGASFGPARTPYASIFRAVVKPRLKSSPTSLPTYIWVAFFGIMARIFFDTSLS